MGGGDNRDGGKKPYRAPVLRPLDASEVIRRLLAGLEHPLGETHEQRIDKAAKAINAVLERLPVEERGEALTRVIAASPGWIR